MKCVKLSDSAGTVLNVEHVIFLSKSDDGRTFFQTAAGHVELEGSPEDIEMDRALIADTMLGHGTRYFAPPMPAHSEVIGFRDPVLGATRLAVIVNSAGETYLEGTCALPDESAVKVGQLVQCSFDFSVIDVDKPADRGIDPLSFTLLVRRRNGSMCDLISWGPAREVPK